MRKVVNCIFIMLLIVCLNNCENGDNYIIRTGGPQAKPIRSIIHFANYTDTVAVISWAKRCDYLCYPNIEDSINIVLLNNIRNLRTQNTFNVIGFPGYWSTYRSWHIEDSIYFIHDEIYLKEDTVVVQPIPADKQADSVLFDSK